MTANDHKSDKRSMSHHFTDFFSHPMLQPVVSLLLDNFPVRQHGSGFIQHLKHCEAHNGAPLQSHKKRAGGKICQKLSLWR